jgi:molecular chaperone GrpE
MNDADNQTWEDSAGKAGPEGQDRAAAEVPERDMAAEIGRLESDLADAKDRMLRAMAETENVRRRLEREKDDVSRYAISRFARDLLDVADNLQRALEAVPQTALQGNEFLEKLVDGVGATGRSLTSVFERNGVKRFDPAGQAFDPNFHEVLFEVDSPDAPAGAIVQVLESGYMLGDRLLRPARVGVAKSAPKS